jgi:hypothetical protein
LAGVADEPPRTLFSASPLLNPDISDAEARLAGTCLQQDRGCQNDSRLKV